MRVQPRVKSLLKEWWLWKEPVCSLRFEQCTLLVCSFTFCCRHIFMRCYWLTGQFKLITGVFFPKSYIRLIVTANQSQLLIEYKCDVTIQIITVILTICLMMGFIALKNWAQAVRFVFFKSKGIFFLVRHPQEIVNFCLNISRTPRHWPGAWRQSPLLPQWDNNLLVSD